MTILSVRLPDIGEGVTQAELVEWLVKLGDLVQEDAPLAAVMTDKATVEIPSLHSGRVTWVAGEVGDVLAIGTELVRIDTGGAGHAGNTSEPEQQPTPEEPAPMPRIDDLPAPSQPSGGATKVRAMHLPDVGEGVTEAELVEWYVKPGQLVREDDLLAAVMTDKATVEIPSIFEGRIVALGGAIGEIVAIGSTLVTIETAEGRSGSAQASAKVETAPAPAPEPTAKSAPTPAPPPAPRPKPTPASAAAPGAPRPEGTEPLASPSVRARARSGGIDLRAVPGAGPAGRITHDDLDRVFGTPALPRDGGGAGGGVRARREGTDEIKVIGMRRKIAERMSLANARIPHITVVEEVDMTVLESLRERLNADRGDRPKLTVLPFITAALARAFVAHPEMNAHFDDDAGVVTRHKPVHLGVATMTDAGLVVPVLRHAETFGVFETAAEIVRLSDAARNGSAKRQELTGSTFTITSLGPIGAIATTPIINHPEVAILGINKMAVRPMWDGSSFQPRKMMNISASFDHRVIDGWDAATFVQQIKSLLETPATIFVDF